MDYQVGPIEALLGQSNASAFAQPLTRPGQVPWVKHPVALGWLNAAVAPAAYELRELFRKTTGTPACYGYPARRPAGGECVNSSDRFYFLPSPALTSNATQRLTTIRFYLTAYGGDESNLLNVPITFLLDESVPDVSRWRTFNFVYCNQGPFDTAEELAGAFDSGSLRECTLPPWATSGAGAELGWALTLPFRPPRNATAASNAAAAVANGGLQSQDTGTLAGGSNTLASARSYMPQGSRVTVIPSPDGTGAQFGWLEWGGHVAVDAVRGLSLHDVRFRGQRIAYELATQELYVSYNGYSGAGQTYFFDSAYGIGVNFGPLTPGQDCPNHAVFLDVVAATDASSTGIQPDALCIFEDDLSTTAWRHRSTAGANRGTDSSRAVELVVRAIATISNYDYIFSLRFRLDGSIGAGVEAGGYMETTFWQYPPTNGDLPFGTPVQRSTFANLHDHLSGWKVDLDVLGTSNTFVKEAVQVGSFADALARGGSSARRPGEAVSVTQQRPGWLTGPDTVKYLQATRPPRELGLSVNLSAPAVWLFLSNETNSWGQRRGFAVGSAGLPARQLLPDDHPLLGAASWTKYDLAVTVQHDSEPADSASRFDVYQPQHPFVSLDDFINGESVTNADLVGWVQVGVQHIPRSEDIPVVTNFGSAFTIRPWNYFNQLASRTVYDAPIANVAECGAPLQGIQDGSS